MTMPKNDVQAVAPTESPPMGTGQQPNTEGPRAQIREVKEQVVEQAKTSFRQVRDSAASSLTDSRNKAADSMGSIAGAVRSTGDRLRSENQASVANLTDSLADQVERLSSYLRSRDLSGVREDLESFARRQPAVAIGVALAVGVLGARFIKSSQRSGGSGSRDFGRADYEVDTGSRDYASGAYGVGRGENFGRGSHSVGGGHGGA
jgi:ElaB/YqjD/DUF883 family membrane-anchored ribosome-binding protein